MAVKFIIDSASDVLPSECKKLGVVHVPLTVCFGDKMFADAVDMTHKKFYKMLTSGTEAHPTTSQASPAVWADAMEEVVQAGDTAVVITVSSRLSGTYQSACIAADDVMKAQSQYLNPYILEERQLNVTQMDVFSRLMMDRIIFLGTQIDDYTANTLQAQLLYLDSVDSGKDISIYINSPGGSVYAGLGIYDTMQFISSDVATICTGMAASMAAVLLVSGAEGKRSALTHSRVMIHQPLGGVQGQASDIEITAREIQKLKNELYTIIADHSHTPFEKVWADSDRDYWMTAQEAKEYGMIDQVLIRK